MNNSENNPNKFKLTLKSPLFIIGSIIVSAFISGFGVKEYFENYKVEQLNNQVITLEKDNNLQHNEIIDLRFKLNEIAYEDTMKKKNQAVLADYLVTDGTKDLEQIAEEFPAEYGKLIIASGIRQLLSSVGECFFISPEGILLSYIISIDESSIQGSWDRKPYNLIAEEFKENNIKIKRKELEQFYIDLSIYGVARSESKDKKQKVVLEVIMTPESGFRYLIFKPDMN
jgi:hypothetical protein